MINNQIKQLVNPLQLNNVSIKILKIYTLIKIVISRRLTATLN